MAKKTAAGAPDNSFQYVILVFAVIVGLYLLYEYVLKEHLNPLFFSMRFIVLAPFYAIAMYLPALGSNIVAAASNIAGGYDRIPEAFHYFFAILDPDFYRGMHASKLDSPAWTLEQMIFMGNQYSRFSAFVVVPIIFVYLYNIQKIETFKALYNQNTLLRRNERVFSAIAPIVERNIAKEPLNVGEWALPDTPLLFAMKHKLLIKEPRDTGKKKDPVKPEEDDFFSLTEVYDGIPNDFNSPKFRDASLVPSEFSPYLRKNNLFRADYAASLFIRQLGEKINGLNFIGALKRKSYDECGNFWRPVLAGMLYRFGNTSEDKFGVAYPLLDRFARACGGKGKIHHGMLDFCTEEEADRVWDGYETNYDFIRNMLIFMTFEMTAFMHLVNWAKRKGKISPSDYIWLRAIDRTLYFSMDQVGSRVGQVEALGPFSHFSAEKVHKSGLHLPYIKDAVEGLATSLASEGWLPQGGNTYTQRSQLSIWETNASIHNLSSEAPSGPEEKIREALVELAGIPGIKHIRAICPSLPPFLTDENLDFFSPEEQEEFRGRVSGEAFALLKKDQTKKGIFGMFGRCPVCLEPFSDGGDQQSYVRALPDFTLEVNAEGRGVWRFSGVSLMCNACVPRRTVYSQGSNNLVSLVLVDHLETHFNIKKDDSHRAFSLLEKLSVLYSGLAWEYEATSSPLADMAAYVKKIKG